MREMGILQSKEKGPEEEDRQRVQQEVQALRKPNSEFILSSARGRNFGPVTSRDISDPLLSCRHAVFWVFLKEITGIRLLTLQEWRGNILLDHPNPEEISGTTQP